MREHLYRNGYVPELGTISTPPADRPDRKVTGSQAKDQDAQQKRYISQPYSKQLPHALLLLLAESPFSHWRQLEVHHR